jgi:NAD(P)-dependent dehydrogenase (short-subunit alcohol dehydrogenase family)
MVRLDAPLTSATVVVTGVGRRGQVGETVARTLAAQGARVVLVDRDAAAAAERAAELTGFDAHAMACDLTDPDATGQLAADVARFAPEGVHALVNLAGGYTGGQTIAGTPPESWHRMIAINLTTAFVATRAFLPLLRTTRGSLVYFTSSAALPGAGVAEMGAYATAKGGVITLMRAVAAEERGAGVRANALAPTSIRTESNLQSMGESAKYVEREVVADWVLWLCSPLSGPITGQVIRLG